MRLKTVFGVLVAISAMAPRAHSQSLRDAVELAIGGEATRNRDVKGFVFVDTSAINGMLRAAGSSDVPLLKIIEMFPNNRMQAVSSKSPAVVQGLREGGMYISVSQGSVPAAGRVAFEVRVAIGEVMPGFHYGSKAYYEATLSDGAWRLKLLRRKTA